LLSITQCSHPIAISASALMPPAQQSAAHLPESSTPASPVAAAAFSVLEGLAFEAFGGGLPRFAAEGRLISRSALTAQSVRGSVSASRLLAG
jgi:hypothetical protein